MTRTSHWDGVCRVIVVNAYGDMTRVFDNDCRYESSRGMRYRLLLLQPMYSICRGSCLRL